MARLNQNLKDLAAIRQTIASGGHLRLHFSYSRGGTVTCRMWHPDGFVMGRAGGGGYDKKGAALGDALMQLFPDDLKSLPLPVRRANGSVESGLYGLNETKEGKRYLDGACGFSCMEKVLEALGFKVQTYETGRNSSMLIAERSVLD